MRCTFSSTPKKMLSRVNNVRPGVSARTMQRARKTIEIELGSSSRAQIRCARTSFFSETLPLRLCAADLYRNETWPLGCRPCCGRWYWHPPLCHQPHQCDTHLGWRP